MSPSRALRAELEHRCLRGLGEVAGALAGEDPAVVCTTFARWQDEARRPWPWLAGMCWAALEPLGIAFSEGDRHAVVAGRLLVGGETDPVAAAAAVEHLRDRPAPAASRSAGADPQWVMRRQRLGSAVDAFWAAYARAARRLHEHVREGDREAADDLVVATRRRLEELADRLAHLADESVALAVAGDRSAALATGGSRPASVTVDGEPTGPLAMPRPVAARPSRPPRKPESRRPGAARARDGREYARLSEHPYAPAVFVAVVCLVAVAWLLRLAAG